MDMPHRHRVIRATGGFGRAVLVCALVLAGLPAGTTEVRTSMSVGARVMPVAHLAMSGPSSITVTQEDVARGVVEVATPTQLHVQTNSRVGFTLNVWPASEIFSSAELSGPEGATTVGVNGASIVNRWKSADRQTTLSITHRFHLASGLTPGVYTWPLKYEVVPIQ
jgi:hypothetical protein